MNQQIRIKVTNNEILHEQVEDLEVENCGLGTVTDPCEVIRYFYDQRFGLVIFFLCNLLCPYCFDLYI
jgi:sulfatase maturation enzyme AslB (radical SAM superfamily)